MAEKLEILLKGCKRGKARSQEALYRRFAAAMYGLCLQYASGEEDAQDILQEGFIKVFEKLDQVKNPEALPGWIRRVMINTALERYRNQVSHQSVDDLKGGGPEEVPDQILSELTCEELVALIPSKRDKRWRCPVELRSRGVAYARSCREKGEPVADIAIRLGLVESTLARWLRREKQSPNAALTSPGFRSVSIQ